MTRGPCVWLTACCHGDEVGGVVVVQEVFKRLRKVGLRCGSVHAFPLMNPLGFEVASRRISLSDEDLNRAFPGNARGTFAQRLAHKIFSTIIETGPDFVIDLHNDWIRSIPYAVLDAWPDEPFKLNHSIVNVDQRMAGSYEPFPPEQMEIAYLKASNAAAQLGLIIVEEPKPIRHTLSHALLAHGIPALTFELGESFVVNERHVQTGVDSIWQLLNTQGVVTLDGSLTRPPSESERLTGQLAYGESLASNSGIIRFLVKAGDNVSQGQPIARIVDAFGKQREVIVSSGNGIVLGLADSSVAYPGAPVTALGLKT